MSSSPVPQTIQRSWLQLLRPLVPLYAAAATFKDRAYAHHWLHSERLQAPVISVGNLSVGGAGKTPLVIRLAELLAARGLAVDVLSRGYGRRSRSVEQVRLPPVQDAGYNAPEPDTHGRRPPPASASADAERYGDEPLLIAQASGVSVYVGASRYAAGLLAEERTTASARVHLLDDGFQHRQLTRAVDIVVLHRSDFAAGLLPAGRLREPLSSLRRASIAVMRVEDAALELELRLHFAGPLWWMTREIVLPPMLSSAATLSSAHPSAVAFCGIARPEEFFSSLRHAGVSLTGTHAFRDHHAYTLADIATLVRSAQRTGAGAILTTEKDLIRLSTEHRALLHGAAPLAAIPLRARLLDEAAALTQLLAMIGP